MNTILKLAGLAAAVIVAEVCYRFIATPHRQSCPRRDLSDTERTYWEAKKQGRARTLDEYAANLRHIEEATHV